MMMMMIRESGLLVMLDRAISGIKKMRKFLLLMIMRRAGLLVLVLIC
jgi:hypothetical protein